MEMPSSFPSLGATYCKSDCWALSECDLRVWETSIWCLIQESHQDRYRLLFFIRWSKGRDRMGGYRVASFGG
jgi:hypothetical protein